MTHSGSTDPAQLGRRPLTRWMPVLFQARPTPPVAEPFPIRETDTPRRFLLRVMTSVPKYSIAGALCGIGWQVGESLVPIVMGAAIDSALTTQDVGQLILWLIALAGVFTLIAFSFRFASRFHQLGLQIVQHRLRTTLSRAVLHVDGPKAQRPPMAASYRS